MVDKNIEDCYAGLAPPAGPGGHFDLELIVDHGGVGSNHRHCLKLFSIRMHIISWQGIFC